MIATIQFRRFCLLVCSLKTKELKDTLLYYTIILPVVLYGCETLSLTLRDKHRSRVFESRVLRGMFGQKRDEITGTWRKLHNDELHNLYSSANIIRMIRRMRWAWYVAYMGRREVHIGFWWESQKERDN
jgi:hypothetical protein